MGAELVQFGDGVGGEALEEVLGVGDDDGVPGLGGGGEEGGEDFGGAELILCAGDEELGLGAGGEEVVAVVAAGGADGEAESDEAGDAGVSAAGAEGYVGAEGEAGEEDRFGEVGGEVVEGGADVVHFAATFIVDAFREAGAAEVEAQDGDAEGGEGLGGVVDDPGVHGAAGGGVGVGDEGGVGGVVEASVEDGFEAARGSAEIIDGADGGEEWHSDRVILWQGAWFSGRR